MTYSIIGRDDSTGELGVAVQSRAFGVDALARLLRADEKRLEEEVEIARAAGLPEDQVAVTAALVAGAHGPAAEADPRWLEAFDRDVRLGYMPQAVLDRLG